jgi:hypothetical protein
MCSGTVDLWHLDSSFDPLDIEKKVSPRTSSTSNEPRWFFSCVSPKRQKTRCEYLIRDDDGMRDVIVSDLHERGWCILSYVSTHHHGMYVPPQNPIQVPRSS